jgi:hypothetical protein
MKTKCPNQHEHIPRKENHPYAPHPKMKPHPKSAWQNFENPLTLLKCINHM